MKFILILLCAVVAITTASPEEKESPIVEKPEAKVSKREDVVDPVKKAEEIRIAQEKLRALKEARERLIERQQLYLDSLYRQSIWNPYRVQYYQRGYVQPFLGLSPWYHY
ncbi:uncharacterized protein LOC109609413 isoform X2 [Aethina tumida]|uniref:uncharacterized protein LOC109609413 isoform X1 n=1 Tax=Aethina tumida TaxID=116153 RepID=UPI00096B0B46|nr:uncharacterized protein LOC109609413 isoform X1 [Aethina tumida]XP_049825819.1 uncharacterized protein LOC109609413 isoform X2 [Aethina tumida]